MIFAASANEIFSSWPDSAFVAGVENRLRQLRRLLQPHAGQLDPTQTVCRSRILLPARPRQVTPHHTFDVAGRLVFFWPACIAAPRCAAQHLPAAMPAIPAHPARRPPSTTDGIPAGTIPSASEPEIRDLRQHLALAWDAVRHDAIERRNHGPWPRTTAGVTPGQTPLFRTLPLFTLRIPGKSSCNNGSFKRRNSSGRARLRRAVTFVCKGSAPASGAAFSASPNALRAPHAARPTLEFGPTFGHAQPSAAAKIE